MCAISAAAELVVYVNKLYTVSLFSYTTQYHCVQMYKNWTILQQQNHVLLITHITLLYKPQAQKHRET